MTMMTVSFGSRRHLASLAFALVMGLLSPVETQSSPSEESLPEWFHGKGTSLKNYLNPNLFADPATMEAIQEELTHHDSLVVIKNAFQHEVAAMVHSEMKQSLKDFVIDKDYKPCGNHHHYRKLDHFETPTLDLISRVFNDVETKSLIADLSDRDCMGEAATSIRWFDRGDYTLPTTDFVYQRTIAFEWLLTKDWLTEWGGATYVNQESHNNGYLHADYNTLLLWHVRPDFTHFVTPVLPQAEGHRLSVSGYFSSQWIPTATDEELENRLEKWPFNFTAIQFQALSALKTAASTLPRQEVLEPLIDEVLESQERPIMATYVFGEEVHEDHWEDDHWEDEDDGDHHHHDEEHWDDGDSHHDDEHWDDDEHHHHDDEHWDDEGHHNDDENWDDEHHHGDHDEHWDEEDHHDGEEPQR